jgi:GNAT superfamily N-acetyltransferase
MWAEGGIGPARIAVMRRAAFPKTAILVRDGQRPAATAFCAIHDDVAMVHALEVRANCRRRGMGRHAMQQAALWAQSNGANWIAAACTRANAGANALYASLGMACVGQYHYRIKTDEESRA